MVTLVHPEDEPDAAALHCRLDITDGSWRTAVRRIQEQLTAGFPNVDDTPVPAGLPYLSVAELSPRSGDLARRSADALLDAQLLSTGTDMWIRVSCRQPGADAPLAARLAGYYGRALAALAEDPDAEHQLLGLVGEAEFEYQTEGLAGPDREVPDQRFHQIFEAYARSQPDAVAAVCGDRSITYAALNRRANMIAHALLAHGTAAEDVVTVVTHRDLDWLAAVIAVFKAGAAYLPIEPGFPPERIATTLEQSDCRIALTSAVARPNLAAAGAQLPRLRTLDLDDDAEFGARPTGDPGLDIRADQLAYLYFTSGSTGRPKGAMCEHGGMMNHLLAKIDDLDIRPGQVVAQTAPQCFDISLWQLVSALLVGGRTLIVEQDVILDIPRFLDTIVAGEVETLQVVPSYLEMLLTNLEEQPRSLGRLRHVSATGEALKWELTSRWFRQFPDIKLVNAYGLTETSDDTNHEVMDRAPADGRVPLGSAVNNVRVYVVDENLNLVPLGAPGEIVFSGVCVGRGYINDEARTRQAFVTDPFRADTRLYRSGDFGRWLPGGKLAFLGRRDAQVKIRGFRIEIGEIENELLRLPGLRDAAVVVVGSGESAQLAAFYSSAEETDGEDIRAALAARLPRYMVPTLIHRLAALPTNANGKLDGKELVRVAETLTAQRDGHRPARTPHEKRLVAAWAAALRVPEDQISRDDHFFERGGTSLSAIKMIADLGRPFTLNELTTHPVLSDLAPLLDRS
ncbi:non-ribosomal peptide synthetase [Micromonospora sp. NPDC005220]|uniref:non-ribosomal peptide synthetase n=1 Tax=Micromonospora sp. NPDC005220 TaxID=3155589 RepID=UPI0033AE54E8